VFTLPDSVEAVPEYLCHEGMLTRMAAAHGLRAGTSMYFDEAAVQFAKRRRFADVARKMGGHGLDCDDTPEALDTANLYRVMAFSACPAVLDSFRAALKS
jgi:hypothetical protein